MELDMSLTCAVLHRVRPGYSDLQHRNRLQHQHHGEGQEPSAIAASGVSQHANHRRSDEATDVADGVDQADAGRCRGAAQQLRRNRPEDACERPQRHLRDGEAQDEHPRVPLKHDGEHESDHPRDRPEQAREVLAELADEGDEDRLVAVAEGAYRANWRLLDGV